MATEYDFSALNWNSMPIKNVILINQIDGSPVLSVKFSYILKDGLSWKKTPVLRTLANNLQYTAGYKYEGEFHLVNSNISAMCSALDQFEVTTSDHLDILGHHCNRVDIDYNGEDVYGNGYSEGHTYTAPDFTFNYRIEHTETGMQLIINISGYSYY